MKSERRHELQENTLGLEIQKTVEFFKAKGNYIAGAVLVAVLIVMVVVYVRGKAEDRAAELQMQYESRNSAGMTPQAQVELLESLSAQRDDKGVAALATVDLGDLFARRMLAAGPTADPAQWKELGDKSEGYYRTAIASFGDERLAAAKAHLGLARLLESRRDFEAARAEYETVKAMTDLEGQPVVFQALRGLAQLDELSAPVQMATTAPAVKAEEAPSEQAPQAPVGAGE